MKGRTKRLNPGNEMYKAPSSLCSAQELGLLQAGLRQAGLMPSTLGAVHRARPVHQVSQAGLGCPDKAALSSVVTHHCTLFLGDSLLITLIKWLQTVLLKIFFFYESGFLKSLCREWQNEPRAPRHYSLSQHVFCPAIIPWVVEGSQVWLKKELFEMAAAGAHPCIPEDEQKPQALLQNAVALCHLCPPCTCPRTQAIQPWVPAQHGVQGATTTWGTQGQASGAAQGYVS